MAFLQGHPKTIHLPARILIMEAKTPEAWCLSYYCPLPTTNIMLDKYPQNVSGD